MVRATFLFFRHYLLVPLSLVVVATSLLLAGMIMPNVGWMWGFGAFDQKASLIAQAMYWSAKVKLNGATVVPPDQTLYADIIDISPDARITVLLPDKKKYVRKTFAIANIKMNDAAAAAQASRALTGRPVKLHAYGEAMVIWDGDRMINLGLIEEGRARPDPNPPSPVYHAIFAEHLWMLVKG